MGRWSGGSCRCISYQGGELFAKRRKRAENWVVDETSIGQAKPSAFADKFMQEQTQQQVAFQQQQQFEQQQEAKQTFAQQQQFKQEQSLEIRRQQEEQMMAQQQMSQQQMDFPQNFQHTDLKARSFTPSLDLGVHNVQGINVWANTAPRGWSTSYQRTKATPPKSIPPTVSVCPATPSLDTEIIQQRMQETKIAEQEEHMRFQQEQQMMQMQQEQQMKMQMDQQEQIRLQEEQIRIQRQQEEQMRMQQQQEQQMMMKRQQQEEQRRIQMQQEEQRRIQQQQEEQMRMQQQQEEQMRIQQQQEEQMRMQQQQEMMMQQQSMSQTTSQVSSSSSTTKSGGFAVESRPQPVQIESQLAQPPMSSSSFESSQSQSFAQQSSSIQQSSSSYSQSQTSQNEVFESQEFSGGVMKGYRMKQDQVDGERETGEKMLSSGVFGGIGADNNSLVDTEIDYKKHTVKDLAKHFALVKPKADIPNAILPEQRMYNGDQGPALNYLGSAKSEMGSSSSTQSFMKKEISEQDFEASKQAYEMKKKQQAMESQQSQSTTSQSTVVKRTETSASSEQTKTVLNERRRSLTAGLMLDPATAHAESGIIDPSAILRGETSTHWKNSDPSPPKTSLRAISSSPSSQMYISNKAPGPRTFAPVKFNTLPRKSQPQASLPPIPSKPIQNESINQQNLSQSQMSNMNTSTETHLTPQNPSLPPSSPNPIQQRSMLPPSRIDETHQQSILTPSSSNPIQQRIVLTSASPHPMQQRQLDSSFPSSQLTPTQTQSPNPMQQIIVLTPASPNPMQQRQLDSSYASSQLTPTQTQNPSTTPIQQTQTILNISVAPQPAPSQATSEILSFQSNTFDSKSSLHSNSVIPAPAVSNSSYLSPNPITKSPSQDMVPEYECSVKTSSRQFAPTPTPVIILDQTNLGNVSPNIPSTNYQTHAPIGRPVSQTNTHTSQSVHKTSVIQTMLKNTSGLSDLGLLDE